MTLEAELRVTLDAPLPAELRVGRGTAFFVCGWCYSPAGTVVGLEFDLGGERQPVAAFGMPRLDPFRMLHPQIDPYAVDPALGDPASAEDPSLHSYRSGFWGVVRVTPGHGELVLGLRATLASGAVAHVRLGRIPLASGGRHGPAATRAAGRVAICMATYNPPQDLLEHQIESIRAQTHGDWVCVISDDCSRPERYAALQAAVAGDPRFVLSRSPSRLGFYRNFERALAMSPPDAAFVALADQDDRWYPEKLATLLERIGDRDLVYSDARVVSRSGETIAQTYWSRRRPNHEDLISLLIANPVTGAASLLRAGLLDDALPFPPDQFAEYHDHWLALVAACRGGIVYVEEPLYDYVQHGSAALGHDTANQMTSLATRLRTLRTRSPAARVRKWRMHYFVDVARLQVLASILQMRCGPDRTLERFARGDTSPAWLARLAARGVRELVGRPETLGAEWVLFGALLWRRLLDSSVRPLPQRRLRLDALPPADLAPGPARVTAPLPAAAAALAEKIRPLDVRIDAAAPRRVNLLIPAVDIEHLFGGYIAKFNLARRLAARGHRVRILAVDPTPPLPHDWRSRLERQAGMPGGLAGVEIEFARARAPVVSPADAFIATTWWTAHIAAAALDELGRHEFLYLVQEYEPLTFAAGSYAALADASYRLPHRALYSTELLRDFFRERGIGDADGLVFRNAITSASAPPSPRSERALLVYARPEPHAARNMFELAMLALAEAVEAGAFAGWTLRGVGSLGGANRLALGGGAELEMLPRMAVGEYAAALARHDVGLALMGTPHPSLVPIEMAAAGMLAVTSTYANKTADALRAISPNLLGTEPTVAGVCQALQDAARRSADLPARVRGSTFAWPRTWEEAFPDELLEDLEAVLSASE